MLKKILLALLIVLGLIQFIRPPQNLGNDQTGHISTLFPMPAQLQQTLRIACYDCHSNLTRYPWYFKLQPAAWFMENHVVDGKRHLNFSELAKRPVWLQYKKLHETQEMIDKGEMPLGSYTLIHKDAILKDGQKQEIIDWAVAAMDSLKAHNPADSLIPPKRKGAPAGR